MELRKWQCQECDEVIYINSGEYPELCPFCQERNIVRVGIVKVEIVEGD